MSTKNKKPTSPADTGAPAAMNGLTGEVFTLAEAAAYLRLAEVDVIDLIHSQNLPARCAGGEWRFLKSAVQHWLASGSPSTQTRKEAQFALAGKYQDDPDLMNICEEAYRQRSR